MNFFKNRDNLNCSLGDFVRRFSELEFSLLYFCGVIDNPRNHTYGMREYVGSDLESRRDKIKCFIYKELPELKPKWSKINTKIGNINRDRRFLIHGIAKMDFYTDSIEAILKSKKQIITKKFNSQDIKTLSNDISHLLTGKDGLTGEFLVEFNTHRFNLHNINSKSDDKIIYKVNDIILTDYTEK